MNLCCCRWSLTAQLKQKYGFLVCLISRALTDHFVSGMKSVTFQTNPSISYSTNCPRDPSFTHKWRIIQSNLHSGSTRLEVCSHPGSSVLHIFHCTQGLNTFSPTVRRVLSLHQLSIGPISIAEIKLCRCLPQCFISVICQHEFGVYSSLSIQRGIKEMKPMARWIDRIPGTDKNDYV